MIKFENTEVVGWEHAIRGMRNPMNSWVKSDSYECGYDLDCKTCDHDMKKCGEFYLGENDRDLMQRLRKAGTDHRKYLRMITVYVDITAPLYWWKEFDTYKVGTVANSCSTMHKIHSKEITLDDFSREYITANELYSSKRGNDGEFIYIGNGKLILMCTIEVLNHLRERYIETKDKKYWYQLIQLLPTSYNQKRTVMLNYEVLNNVYKSRKNHKLNEWSKEFIEWIESLPYSEELIMGDEE